MKRKTCFLVGILFISMILFSGCASTQGISTQEHNLYNTIMKADEWIKNNIW